MWICMCAIQLKSVSFPLFSVTRTDYGHAVGADGAIYQWELDGTTASRKGEFVTKGIVYHQGVVSPDGHTVFCIGTDYYLKELTFPSSHVVSQLRSEVPLAALALAKNMKFLIVATAAEAMPGIVRCYPLPLSESYTSLKVLSGPIRQVRLTMGDALLVVTGT